MHSPPAVTYNGESIWSQPGSPAAFQNGYGWHLVGSVYVPHGKLNIYMHYHFFTLNKICEIVITIIILKKRKNRNKRFK